MKTAVTAPTTEETHEIHIRHDAAVRRPKLSETLLSERRDNVLILTLNRTSVRNAVNAELAQALARALDDFDNDPTLLVAILTGAGGNFCAGMDLKAFARGESISTPRGLLGATELPPSKPMIAAVEGWALAGGCELALSCDLIVAGNSAKFGIPEVTRGIIAAAGGLRRLPLALPYHIAMELALTGAPLTSQRAYHLGMINRVVDDACSLQAALDLAEVIKRNGPLAVRTSKHVMSTASGWNDPEFWENQRESEQLVFNSEDAHEGAVAFEEKRDPIWTGR